MPAPRRYILLLYGLLLLVYGGWAALWLTAPQAYSQMLKLWDVGAVRPTGLPASAAPVPFFDLEGVISWSECSHEGVDVFRINPCDPAPYNRPVNYSPLVADLPLHWIGTRNVNLAGLVVDGAFLLILPLVFRPRNVAGLAIAAAAAASHATFYALERGNLDVVVFGAIALAALASQKTRRGRLWLYGVALGGGLIKFYPLALGLVAVRERWRTTLAVAAVFTAVVAAFCIWYWPALHLVAANLPGFRSFSDMFGAAALPDDIAWTLRLPYWTVSVMKLVLAAGLLLFAWRFSSRFRIPASNWLAPDQLMLLCGAIIIVGCFLLQTNNSYRAVFLMLAIPGLLSLRRRSEGLHRMLFWTVAAALVLMWADIPRAAGAPWRPLIWTIVMVRDILWWFEAAVLAGIILCFVRRAPAVKEALGLAQGRPVFGRLAS